VVTRALTEAPPPLAARRPTCRRTSPRAVATALGQAAPTRASATSTAFADAHRRAGSRPRRGAAPAPPRRRARECAPRAAFPSRSCRGGARAAAARAGAWRAAGAARRRAPRPPPRPRRARRRRVRRRPGALGTGAPACRPDGRRLCSATTAGRRAPVRARATTSCRARSTAPRAASSRSSRPTARRSASTAEGRCAAWPGGGPRP
jgi:hypothetical protein